MDRIDTIRTQYSSKSIVSLIALAYTLLGALGLVLAIPPGYASPVFPASGLALASALWFGRRALPGVWLGSLLLNFGQAWLRDTLSPTTAIVAVVIACGAAIQSWAGCWLVNRWQGQNWRNLESGKNAFGFFLLGGVLACLLASLISVTGLLAAGVIERTEWFFTWWNWYVGDTLGVIVFAPLILCLLSEPGTLFGEHRKRIALPMVMTLCLVVVAFYMTSRWEEQSQNNQLQKDGETISRQIGARLIAHREVLTSLHNFIETLQVVNFTQFEQFTKISLQNNSDIFALSFNDLITLEQRPAYEKLMSTLSPLGPFHITERDRMKRLVHATARPEYVAVRYIVPLASNRPAVGFDINSEPIRGDAIKRARASNKIAVTSPIKLVQEERNRVGVLAIMPVEARPAVIPGNKHAGLLGFAVAVVKVDELIDIATRGRIPPGLVIKVTDPLAQSGKELLYSSDTSSDDSNLPDSVGSWKTTLRMGDRDWELSVFTTKMYRQQNRPWMAWAVGVVGLIFAAQLQLLMLSMTGRAAELQRSIEVQKARDIAESASRTKSEFLATMSHEIRTPLNAMLGMTDLLAETPLDNVQSEYLVVIQTAGETLQRLINDILDFSKIEAGKLQLDTVPFRLPDSVNQVMTMLSGHAGQKKLSLEASIASDVPFWLSGDSYRLRQVLINLLGNAVKFTEQGKVSLKVDSVASGSNEAILKFSITDTGIGISPDKLQAIFDHFTQADSSTTRNYGGSGLGLAISKRLVGMMGGELCVESTEGQGSCFYFTCRFPVPTEIPDEPQPIIAENKSDRSLSILLVDDNKDNRTVLQAYFRKTAHSVETAVNGEDAVTKIKQGNYDLVFLDMQMPVMDGYTAVRLIREWEQETGREPLPIIALTANALKEDRWRSLEAGCTDHLTKPIDKKKMLETVMGYTGV